MSQDNKSQAQALDIPSVKLEGLDTMVELLLQHIGEGSKLQHKEKQYVLVATLSPDDTLLDKQAHIQWAYNDKEVKSEARIMPKDELEEVVFTNNLDTLLRHEKGVTADFLIVLAFIEEVRRYFGKQAQVFLWKYNDEMENTRVMVYPES